MSLFATFKASGGKSPAVMWALFGSTSKTFFSDLSLVAIVVIGSRVCESPIGTLKTFVSGLEVWSRIMRILGNLIRTDLALRFVNR